MKRVKDSDIMFKCVILLALLPVIGIIVGIIANS